MGQFEPIVRLRSDAALPSEAARINRLLDTLPPDEFSQLAPHFRAVPLKRGAVLYQQGEDTEAVYFPHSGLISVLAIMPEGKMVETMTVGRDGAIGLTTGIGSLKALNFTIIRVPGWATKIPASRWSEVVKQSQALQHLIVRYNDTQASQLQQTVACRTLHNVEARLCRWLLEARDRVGSEKLPLTQQLLADALGVHRITVTLVAESDALRTGFRRKPDSVPMIADS